MKPISTSTLLLAAAIALTPGCRKRKPQSTTFTPPPVVEASLQTNALAEAPSPFLRSQASSSVHWQMWHPSLLPKAVDARRLIFVLAVSPQYPGCISNLKAIENAPAVVRSLNENFIPVLTDLESSREVALIAGRLSPEAKIPVSFPFLLVLSPEGNPVTWRPLSFDSTETFTSLVIDASEVVQQMWLETPAYVINNSRSDQEKRLQDEPATETKPSSPAETEAYLNHATRRLTSLYDSDIRSMSDTGGLLPVGILQCLSAAAIHRDTPPDLAAAARQALDGFGPTVLSSPMFDPLDGGIFPSRLGGSWQVPAPTRTATHQARSIRALVSLHAATGNQTALAAALRSIDFTEKTFLTSDQLFSPLPEYANPTLPGDWFWSLTDLEKKLSPSEVKLWTALAHLENIGNLPSEADPKRTYFRLNSLAIRTPLAKAAETIGISTQEALQLFDSSRRKLLDARAARLGAKSEKSTGAASPSFRMISAYAALYTATGNDTWRQKATSLGQRARSAFQQGSTLLEFPSSLNHPSNSARAFTYAIAIQAALDLAEITLDDNWRIWAGDLATTVSEKFSDDSQHLFESTKELSLANFPIEDRFMLFDDSTVGVMRMNLARLKALGQPPPPAIAHLMETLPNPKLNPVIVTDSILALRFAPTRAIVELPTNPDPAWIDAAAKLPLDRIARRIGSQKSAAIVLPDGSRRDLPTPEALRDFLPPPSAF